MAGFVDDPRDGFPPTVTMKLSIFFSSRGPGPDDSEHPVTARAVIVIRINAPTHIFFFIILYSSFL
jgi:hypothetical protein